MGDVADTGGPLTLQDAVAVSATSGGVPNPLAETLPGFAAFPNLDPVIIGDVALQGGVNPTDAGAMFQQVAGSAKNTIPYAPIGLPIAPVGPDTTLSVLISNTPIQSTADGSMVTGAMPTALGGQVGGPLSRVARMPTQSGGHGTLAVVAVDFPTAGMAKPVQDAGPSSLHTPGKKVTDYNAVLGSSSLYYPAFTSAVSARVRG